jgi:2-polyprenyl-6-methoxyphenol hydroxylase-like FAD-dependent oxidoreductase
MLLMPSRRRMGACYTSWDGRLQYALMIAKGAFREARDTDWAEEMATAAPPWLAEHIRAAREQIEGPVLLDVMAGRCPRWSAPGLLLIGDAAHPMSPIRAQGINLALRDVIVTANHLLPVLRNEASHEALDAAMLSVQREREPEIIRAQTLQTRDTRGFNTWMAPVAMAVAKRLGKLVGRFGWAQRAWLRQQRDLRFGIADVRLTV